MKYVKPTLIIFSISPVKVLSGSPHTSSSDNNSDIDNLEFDNAGNVRINDGDEIM